MILWLLSFLSLSLYGADEMPKKIHLQTQIWPPYQYQKGDEVDGIAVKAVRCAFERLKIPLAISVVPWNRAQNNTRDEKADGFFAASKNQERDQYAVLSKTLIPQDWVWFRGKDKKSELTKKSIHGALKGSNMLSHLKSEDYNVGLEAIASEDLFKALKLQRVDHILVSGLVAQELEERRLINLSSFEKSVYKQNPLGVYFASRLIKRYPKFLEAFNSKFEICVK